MTSDTGSQDSALWGTTVNINICPQISHDYHSVRVSEQLMGKKTVEAQESGRALCPVQHATHTNSSPPMCSTLIFQHCPSHRTKHAGMVSASGKHRGSHWHDSDKQLYMSCWKVGRKEVHGGFCVTNRQPRNMTNAQRFTPTSYADIGGSSNVNLRHFPTKKTHIIAF